MDDLWMILGWFWHDVGWLRDGLKYSLGGFEIFVGGLVDEFRFVYWCVL